MIKRFIICIVAAIIIIIFAIIIFSSSDGDVSEIKAVYLIQTDSKITKLINSNFIGYIRKMTIDYKEVEPCNEFYFKKGYHYVTFYIKKINNAFQMFSGAIDLLEINLENFDASDVSDMGYMFFMCTSLDEVRFPKLQNNNLKKMDSMFEGC